MDNGGAHLVRKPANSSVEARLSAQSGNLYHARYVCQRGGGTHRRWACRAATGWLLREWRETWSLTTVGRMVSAAEQVNAESDPAKDPWPNCPDPYDGTGSSWHDTKACESPGYGWGEDPPGWYCGPLQIDPVIWAHVIRKWGVPC